MTVEEYLRHSLMLTLKLMTNDCRRHHDNLEKFPDEAWVDLDYDQLEIVNDAIERCKTLIATIFKHN